MAIQVINDPYRNQDINDSTFGGALATGLGSGLRRLAENKLQQINQRNQFAEMSQRLEGLGLNPQEAQFAATLPPKEQLQLLQMLGSSQQQQQVQPMNQQLSMYEQSPIEQQLPQQQRSEQPKNFLQKISAGGSKEDKAEQHRINKETEKIYQNTFKEAKGAAENEKRLTRMESLIKKGNLPGAGWGTILKGLSKGVFGVGIDLYPLTHADTQEFEKLSTDFLKNAKDIFGSRVTNYDIENFLKTVPSLSQTNAGKMRVINNLRAANEAANIRKDTMEKIIKANGGKRPANLEGLIEEFSGPRIDALAEQFKESAIPAVEEPEFGQLRGKKKRQTLAEEIEAFKKNPNFTRLFFQQED